MIDNRDSKVFRGIAILMVIASHYAGWMYTEPLNETWRTWISTWGVYGVDVFFLLSGYGLVRSASRNGIDKRFVVKRFTNSYLPYIVIAGFFALTDKSIDGPKALLRLIIGYDYWFMCVLFVLYAMFMISYRIGRFKEIILTVGVIAFTYILYLRGMADFWELSNGAFLIGVYAATLELRYGSEKVGGLITRMNLACIGLAVMVVFAIVHTMNPTMTCHMLASMSFTIMALGICVQMKTGGVILSALGRYSLYIYLLHTRLFWKFVAYDPEWSYFKGTVIAGIITVMISLTLGYCFDHWISYIEKKRGV